MHYKVKEGGSDQKVVHHLSDSDASYDKREKCHALHVGEGRSGG
jgi:hypothetical protein